MIGPPFSVGTMLGPAFDLIATNTMAESLLPPFDGERNMIRILFTHPHTYERTAGRECESSRMTQATLTSTLRPWMT